MDSVPLPLLAIGEDKHIQSMNKPLQNLLGHHIMGRHYIAALRQPKLLAQIESVFETGGTRTARFLHRVDSADVAYDVQVSRIDQGVLLAFQDRSATEEAIQSRRAFIANVSHELRTPLTALLGFIETLQGAAKDDPDARARFLDIMQSEAVRMTQLVDDLLSLSRVEQDRRVRPTDKIVLADVLKAVLSEMEPLFKKADCEVALDIQAEKQDVHGDDQQLRQVIVNLVENALKYGGAGGVITVKLAAPKFIAALKGDGVRLSVIDTGKGIAPHHLPRLTERFYRVDNHRSRAVGGTGLGLAIVKHIVQRHRGLLGIESEINKGTTVSVSLPIVPKSHD